LVDVLDILVHILFDEDIKELKLALVVDLFERVQLTVVGSAVNDDGRVWIVLADTFQRPLTIDKTQVS
jgi:hypothetical protein